MKTKVRYITATLVASLALLLASCSTPNEPATATATKPNFSGTWKLRSTEFGEIYTFTHREPDFRVVMRIDDPMGQRTMEVRGRIDGMVHEQTVLGYPATFVAWWQGDELVWKFKRDSQTGPMQNRRIMKLSSDGKTITTTRTVILPAPEQNWTEIWDRQ